jgi:hydroxymethylbilane synthase
LQIIRTTGDANLDTPLARIGDKGLFTREIEQHLLGGDIDLAVHSLKDLPADQPDGLVIAAVLAREDAADVLVSKNNAPLADLPAGGQVLSGSLRRRAQILHRRPDLQVVDVRGNIETRLRKLDESDAVGMVLALAGLKRLDLAGRVSQRLDPADFLPACGQGAIAVEVREKDHEVAEWLAPLDDRGTHLCTRAERALLACLEGGCQVPVGAYARVADDRLLLWAMVADLDGQELIRGDIQGPPEKAAELGCRLADNLLATGARDLLDRLAARLPQTEDEEYP